MQAPSREVALHGATRIPKRRHRAGHWRGAGPTAGIKNDNFGVDLGIGLSRRWKILGKFISYSVASLIKFVELQTAGGGKAACLHY